MPLNIGKFNILFVLGLLLTGTAQAETPEDFQTWGNITATGSLDVINPDLKNFKYWLETQVRFGKEFFHFYSGDNKAGLGLSSKPTVQRMAGLCLGTDR